MWSLMTDVCREMGVRTDVPFKDLTDKEKEIVYDGPMEKKHIFYVPKNKNSAAVGDLDMTYYSATATVLNALNKVKDEKGMKRVEKFLKEDICPECRGTRLSEEARAPRLMGISLADACQMTLKESVAWVKRVPEVSAGRNAKHGGKASASPIWKIAATADGSGAWLSDAGSGRPPRSPPESGSGCSLQGPCATGQRAFCMFWTSLPSVCIRRILSV